MSHLELSEDHLPKTILCNTGGVTGWKGVPADLAVSMRLDRLLATQPAMSRSRFHALFGKAKLRMDPERKGALRKPPDNGLRVVFDLSCEPDRRSIVQSTCNTYRDN